MSSALSPPRRAGRVQECDVISPPQCVQHRLGRGLETVDRGVVQRRKAVKVGALPYARGRARPAVSRGSCRCPGSLRPSASVVTAPAPASGRTPTFTDAPASSSSRTTSRCPFMLAAKSGVTRKAMMAFYFKKQEELKKLADDDAEDYMTSSWADPKALKNSLRGTNNIRPF
ncbi:hypothetical protein PINS_up021516 [Pythium insidiosum]|nr:hypothetical protein PINS_up021516 [Pythium insidiosum]